MMKNLKNLKNLKKFIKYTMESFRLSYKSSIMLYLDNTLCWGRERIFSVRPRCILAKADGQWEQLTAPTWSKSPTRGYLIGVYRYTLHSLNGSRTHANVLFLAPTVIITDSQEGQMFRRRRRRRRRCRRRIATIVVDDGAPKDS